MGDLLPYAWNAVFSTFSTFLSFPRTSQSHAWKQFFVRGLHEAPPGTDEISILQSIHTNSKGIKGIAEPSCHPVHAFPHKTSRRTVLWTCICGVTGQIQISIYLCGFFRSTFNVPKGIRFVEFGMFSELS